MITLKHLVEQGDPADQTLRVALVTNVNSKSTEYFGRRVLANPRIDGEIVVAGGNDLKALLDAVSDALQGDPDVVMVQYGGLEETPLKQVQIAFARIRQMGAQSKTPVLFIDNPVSKDSTRFDAVDMWLQKSGFNFIKIGNLTRDYVDRNNRVLNRAGNDVIYRKVMRYLKRFDPKLEPQDLDANTTNKIGPEDLKQKAINTRKAGDALTKAGGVVTIPAALRTRTGETTDWEAVMDFFIDKGMPKAGAAAIAGNMKVESNFKPDAIGDKGTSIGLAQWHNTRMAGLFKFAKDKGLEPKATDTQLEWCWEELNTTFKPVLNMLMKATDPNAAAEDFARMYERPSVISPKRMAYAVQYDEEYSSIEKTIKRGAETVAGAISRGGTALVGAAMAAFSGGSAKTPKVNSKNGQMSSSELKSIGDGHRLSIDAADAFLKMKEAASKDGVDIKLSDSYRTLATQNSIFDWDHYKQTGKRRKKGTASTAAAYPGTSNHGLGRAIDVKGLTAQKWIRDNGEAYGWSWAEGRSVGEPWHFTYVK